MSKDFVMYRIDKDIYKKLQLLKVENDKETINEVLRELLNINMVKIEDEAHDRAKKKAKFFGMSLQEYIRMLIMKECE
jgi:predicted DNA binding CopG/RHH family protein